MFKSVRNILLFSFACCSPDIVIAQSPSAKIFGAMPAVLDISLSPDGNKIAFLSPGLDREIDLYTLDLRAGDKPQRITTSRGDPENLFWCAWVSNERLACKTGAIQDYAGQLYSYTNLFAVNADGSKPQLLTKKQGQNAIGYSLGSGSIIDWMPGDSNLVMMSRYHLADEKIGSRISNTKSGLAAEIVDTMTGGAKTVESPAREAVEYITDGKGAVRIKGMRTKIGATELDSGEIKYYYRDGKNWNFLSEFNYANRTGFNPYAVDPRTNRALGFQRVDGRQAFVSMALDGTGAQEILVKNDEVDVDDLIRIGRDNRVVGASYVTDKRTGVYFDADLKAIATSLGKALGGDRKINFSDSSLDESKLLIWAGSDVDPGQYFLFDRSTKQLRPLLGARPLVEQAKLATVKPVSYAAADGTQIPAYLTLPAGSDGKNLPALVMPHGGPESRDEWGFDWLAQFFANQGFAVIQPNFRGSSGYGDAWFKENGFKGWKTAISDVDDAGKWLIKEGIAKPSALSIFGWSYGGYAALQSAVFEPGLFKAVVAVAPVTDLASLKVDARGYTDSRLVAEYIGTGPHVREGSPAQNADKITVPVLMFHGDLDRNVDIAQSRMMKSKLNGAGKSVTFVEYQGLDHSLRSSAVRAELLQKSLDFLPK